MAGGLVKKLVHLIVNFKRSGEPDIHLIGKM